MELLQQHIAPGAFHNSDERYDPPKCHPHTREAVLKKIMDWVKDADKVALFLWLYGPAGSGKSAIAQTIAELLEKVGLLAAAFFFSRNATGRDDKTPLVATLVYQLVKSIPEIRAHVLEALEGDPALFACSIEAQIEALIVKPLNAVATDETLAPILLSKFSSTVNYPGWAGRMPHHLIPNPHLERAFHSRKTSPYSAVLPHRKSARAGYPPSVQRPKRSRLDFIQHCVGRHLST
jgi:hypothetical protein